MPSNIVLIETKVCFNKNNIKYTDLIVIYLSSIGPICPQNKWYLAAQIAPIPVPEMAEDCLHLNVWTPAVSQATRLPVMLWIHGGGFITGI